MTSSSGQRLWEFVAVVETAMKITGKAQRFLGFQNLAQYFGEFARHLRRDFWSPACIWNAVRGLCVVRKGRRSQASRSDWRGAVRGGLNYSLKGPGRKHSSRRQGIRHMQLRFSRRNVFPRSD